MSAVRIVPTRKQLDSHRHLIYKQILKQYGLIRTVDLFFAQEKLSLPLGEGLYVLGIYFA
jgi:hypothetical protein